MRLPESIKIFLKISTQRKKATTAYYKSFPLIYCPLSLLGRKRVFGSLSVPPQIINLLVPVQIKTHLCMHRIICTMNSLHQTWQMVLALFLFWRILELAAALCFSLIPRHHVVIHSRRVRFVLFCRCEPTSTPNGSFSGNTLITSSTLSCQRR